MLTIFLYSSLVRFGFSVGELLRLVEEVVVVLSVFIFRDGDEEEEEVPPPNLINNVEKNLGFLTVAFVVVEINAGKANELTAIAPFPNFIKLNFLLLK